MCTNDWQKLGMTCIIIWMNTYEHFGYELYLDENSLCTKTLVGFTIHLPLLQNSYYHLCIYIVIGEIILIS